MSASAIQTQKFIQVVRWPSCRRRRLSRYRTRRTPGADRAERRRQDDAAHCIAGTHQPTSGRALLFGKDISNLPENHRRTALGMGRTFQISNICTDLSVRENLLLAALGNDARKWVMMRPARAFADIGARVERRMENIGLAERADELVKFFLMANAGSWSLALALISDPKVLLLDEPCAGLSPSERRVCGLSRLCRRDITLLMIEHDIDIALALADRVTVLHRGRIILDGTPGEVQKDEQVREVYWAASDPLLAVRDIHPYYGDSYVLHGLSLELVPGADRRHSGRNWVKWARRR